MIMSQKFEKTASSLLFGIVAILTMSLVTVVIYSELKYGDHNWGTSKSNFWRDLWIICDIVAKIRNVLIVVFVAIPAFIFAVAKFIINLDRLDHF